MGQERLEKISQGQTSELQHSFPTEQTLVIRSYIWLFFSVPFNEVNIANVVIKYILNAMQSKCAMSINLFNPYTNPITSTIIISILWKEKQRHKQ